MTISESNSVKWTIDPYVNVRKPRANGDLSNWMDFDDNAVRWTMQSDTFDRLLNLSASVSGHPCVDGWFEELMNLPVDLEVGACCARLVQSAEDIEDSMTALSNCDDDELMTKVYNRVLQTMCIWYWS